MYMCNAAAEGADSSVGSIDEADIKPFPVVLVTGEQVTIALQLTMNEGHQIPVGSTASVVVKKEGIIGNQ